MESRADDSDGGMLTASLLCVVDKFLARNMINVICILRALTYLEIGNHHSVLNMTLPGQCRLSIESMGWILAHSFAQRKYCL